MTSADLALVERAVADLLAGQAGSRCLLIVCTDVERLEVLAARLLEVNGWPRVSVAKGVSAALLHAPAARYASLAETWVRETISIHAPDPVLVTEIDLLFEPALRLDPLALLRLAARPVPLIVTWPGTYSSGVLRYAAPGHALHLARGWSRPDVRVHPLAAPGEPLASRG